MKCHSIWMSLKMECHSKFNDTQMGVTQNVMSLKIEFCLKRNILQNGMSLKLEDQIYKKKKRLLLLRP